MCNHRKSHAGDCNPEPAPRARVHQHSCPYDDGQCEVVASIPQGVPPASLGILPCGACRGGQSVLTKITGAEDARGVQLGRRRRAVLLQAPAPLRRRAAVEVQQGAERASRRAARELAELGLLDARKRNGRWRVRRTPAGQAVVQVLGDLLWPQGTVEVDESGLIEFVPDSFQPPKRIRWREHRENLLNAVKLPAGRLVRRFMKRIQRIYPSGVYAQTPQKPKARVCLDQRDSPETQSKLSVPGVDGAKDCAKRGRR